MEVWTEKNMKSVKHFLYGIDSIHQGESLITTFKVNALADELVQWHRIHYKWHHEDTIRSYTQQHLRERGNRGKRVDFAYFNRAFKYFGYDQFAEHRVQRNKLICLWDPTTDGDNFGEHNPCLILVRFQVYEGLLDMNVVFRKRDLLKRMIGNWAMLVMWLNNEASQRNMKPGSITDFSMECVYDEEQLTQLRKGK